MWLNAPIGFFSVVQKPGDAHLTVRARIAEDLDRLRAQYLPELGPTVATPKADYQYRATAPHAAVGQALERLALALHYANFKSEVATRQGAARAHVYSAVWQVLASGLPGLDAPPKKPAKARSGKVRFGGVVFDEQGRLLLFAPKNGYGGYAWTYPKGGAKAGESDEAAALREVAEEGGVEARVVGRLPGAWRGDTSETVYFVMELVRALSAGAGDESAGVRWVTPDEAPALIGKTTSSTGRQRDLQVLAAAVAFRRTQTSAARKEQLP